MQYQIFVRFSKRSAKSNFYNTVNSIKHIGGLPVFKQKCIKICNAMFDSSTICKSLYFDVIDYFEYDTPYTVTKVSSITNLQEPV